MLINLISLKNLSDHAENSIIYWTEKLLKMHDQETLPIARKKSPFLALNNINQEKNLLPSDTTYTISYLKKLAELFWLYDVDETPFLNDWRSNSVPKYQNLQRFFWQEIFLDPKRNFLILSEALNKLKNFPFSSKDLPFSSLFYFSGYLTNLCVLKFLYIFSEKGFKVHHIAFDPHPYLGKSIPFLIF